MSLPIRYPAYPSELILEIVTVSHFDLDRVKQLLGPHPQLARAAWDWGFGDWESPLGAACHMGRRDIAEYLIGLGAPPNVFSAILFADFSMVKEMITKYPKLATFSGPHSISLLAHARMGGKPSEEILRYFDTRGDCDLPKPVPLTDQDRSAICGSYDFGNDSSHLVLITDDMDPYLHTPMYTSPPQLNWTRTGSISRPLFHVGQRTFYPAGAPTVRVNFEIQDGRSTMKIRDGESAFSGSRVKPLSIACI